MRPLLAFLAMTTVAPVVAVTVLVCWNPSRWGGSINPLAIVAMAFFGLFTVPLWPTYLPALALTPFLMSKVAARRAFQQWPLVAILALSAVAGALAGTGVISIIVPWHESLDLVLNWLTAGAVAGAVTLALIAWLYRKLRTGAEPCAAPKGGPATPPPILPARSGPPSVS